MLIDGSDSTISSQALAAVNGVALSQSVAELAEKAGATDLPIRLHPLFLFNPDSRTANLLIPGLVAILLTFSGTLLAAFAIVRERERGTLEQLMVTPASPIAVVLGKLLPYLVLAFLQLLFILFLMTVVFRVPIHGSLPLLLGLSTVYLFALLSLGLLVSSRARTQMEAIQLAQGFLLPSIMLSGYIFPLSSLPGPLARRLAVPAGDPLHRDRAGDHHPGRDVSRPLAQRRRAARDRGRPPRRLDAGVPQDDLLAVSADGDGDSVLEDDGLADAAIRPGLPARSRVERLGLDVVGRADERADLIGRHVLGDARRPGGWNPLRARRRRPRPRGRCSRRRRCARRRMGPVSGAAELAGEKTP